MRIILGCGDRHWKDYNKILRVLKAQHYDERIDFIIEGGQESTNKGTYDKGIYRYHYGADHLIKKAAMELGIQVMEFPANWDKFKLKAGPIRNKKMLEILNLFYNLGFLGTDESINTSVLAFHSNIKESKGTKNMVDIAKKAGVKVRIIK